MTKGKSIISAAALAWSASVVGAAEPANLQQEIEALRAEVRELRAKQDAPKPTFTTADVEAAVDSVLRDADKRSTLLAETSTFYGGYIDDKFQIRSADGNWTLSPSLWLQFRGVTNFNENGKSEGRDNVDNGFEARRLKFSLDGNAFSKQFYYNFTWATDRKTGNLVNEEAYVRWQFADRFAVKAGNYKELIYQETATSSKRKLAVDVSLVGQVLFNGDVYSQGVELNYDDGKDGSIQALVGFSDGYGSVNTNFQDPPTNGFDFGVYGRAQYKVFGDWKAYSDQTALGTKTDLLVVGAGFDWSENGDTEVVRHAVDAQFETGKLGLFGAFVGRYTERASDSTWDCGALVQAGYLIDAQFEIFGRYSYLKLDDASTDENQFHEITVGANYYLKGHSAKVTVDVGWLPSGSPAIYDGIGVLANDGDTQFYIRGQFQLAI
ncbi:MAG TPA: porin [Tepidisphaeraceae bacterium]|nr:porin [Tepidisphaeraceae bacterium]